MKQPAFIIFLLAIAWVSCRNEAPRNEIADTPVPESASSSEPIPKSAVQPVKSAAIKKTEHIQTLPVNRIVNPESEFPDLEQLRAKQQSFLLSPLQDTVIRGEAGSKLAFVHGMLENMDGSEVQGDVKVELTEYVKPSQFAAENLVTKTADGEILETVGMLQILATQGHDTLKLKDGELLAVLFPLHSAPKDYVAWNAVKSDDQTVVWSPQKKAPEMNAVSPKTPDVPVHMVPMLGSDKKAFVNLRTCSGARWQTKFNNRFRFAEGRGLELLDDKNFLAYSFQVNKSGRVSRLYVDRNGLPESIIQLSEKYRNEIELYLTDNYPKLNLCKLPDYRKNVFRFIIKPGLTGESVNLITVSPEDGGYSSEELAELYKTTGEQVYLDGWLAKAGNSGAGKIPQTRAKLSRRLLDAVLSVAEESTGIIIELTSLGMVNGDCLSFPEVKMKYNKGTAIRTLVQGTGAAVYMVFKKARTFLKGAEGTPGIFTFGNRIPKGTEVVLVTVSTRQGQRYMNRTEVTLEDGDIPILTEEPFKLDVFQGWLDQPGTKNATRGAASDKSITGNQ